MGCMLGQLNEPDQKEKVIYYLSKKFTSCEINYITIKKTCYALARASYHAVDLSHGSYQVHL